MKSRAGAAAAVLYLLIAAAAFVAHLYSVKTNPADSGESALPFVLLGLPWTMQLPSHWMGLEIWPWIAYPVGWLCVALNAAILYGLVALSLSGARWLWGKIQRHRD